MTDWPNHAEAWRAWRDAIGGERMHHGWLLAGKAGLGKRDFAMAAARELVAEPGVPQPAGDHPDIIVLTYGPKDDKGEKAQAEGKPFELARSIRVRQIRAMQRRLVTRPTLGSRRAIIIDPADDMEKAAANALLKSLEEPPSGTVFLLVTHRPARLLPTIRSRCRTLRFPILTESQIAAMLAEAALTHDADAIAAAEGSFSAAQRFAVQNLAPIANAISALLAGEDHGMTGRGELARLIGPRADRERVQAVLDLAQSLTARAARAAVEPETRLRLVETHAALVRLAAEAPTANFDPAMLPFEIGSLLVTAAPASARGHG
ncbi:MAG: DNA polymerase III subunit delta' [Sphingomonadales bacterium]|nr:MAG: DNA polymerase III subunit delta' [Sphingomonadales bacterium]